MEKQFIPALVARDNYHRLIAESKEFVAEGLFPEGATETLETNLWPAVSLAEAVSTHAGLLESKLGSLVPVEDPFVARGVRSLLPRGGFHGLIRHFSGNHLRGRMCPLGTPGRSRRSAGADETIPPANILTSFPLWSTLSRNNCQAEIHETNPCTCTRRRSATV